VHRIKQIMAKETKDRTEEQLEAFEQTLTKTEKYIEENRNSLMIIVLAIVLIFGGYYAYSGLYLKPKATKAQTAMFGAENYFKNDSFELALNGDSERDIAGFIEIIEEFGNTPAGNVANYYAGISFLRMGEFEEALTYLSNYSTDSKILEPMAKGAMGDANAELGNNEEALNLYIQAASSNTNDFTSPIYLMKAGNLCEVMGNTDAAIAHYENLMDNYKNSTEGRQAEKLLARLGKF